MATNTQPVPNETGFVRFGNTSSIYQAAVNFITDTSVTIGVPRLDTDKVFALQVLVDQVNVKGTLSQNAIATLDTGTNGQTIASSTTFSTPGTNRYTLMTIPAAAYALYGNADGQQLRLLITQPAIGQATTLRARTDNIALVTTAAPHGLVAGNVVQVASLASASFNGRVTVISAPTTTTFTYFSEGANVTSTADTAGRVGAFDANVIVTALYLGVDPDQP